MIKVTRLKGNELFINTDLILMIEVTPNTVITFTNGIKIVVEEHPSLIIERIAEYQAMVGKLVNSPDCKE